MAGKLDDGQRAELESLIEDHGLTAQARDILKVAQPCIHVTAGKASKRPKMGASRLGGLPDLPGDVAYPRSEEGPYLLFVCQINLAEVPPLPPLPSSGLLYFFVEEDEMASDVLHQVLYHDGDTGSLARAVLPRGAEVCLEEQRLETPRPLTFRRGISLPSLYHEWTQEHVEGEDDDEETMARYLALEDALMGKGRDGQMLGYPSLASMEDRSSKALLLLQVGSVDDMVWWDAGAIQFFIRKQDLTRKRFDRTEAEIYTS